MVGWGRLAPFVGGRSLARGLGYYGFGHLTWEGHAHYADALARRFYLD